jgi:hypothetical protein
MPKSPTNQLPAASRPRLQACAAAGHLDATPDASLLHVACNGAENLVQRSGAHTYSTAYADRYHEDVHGSSVGFLSPFSARGYSKVWTRYSLVARGAFVIANAQFRESLRPVQVKGCPS